ncbi:MAG: polyhydroxyalkanoate synthesis repressor PhaR [Desulfobulbaceae bacterium BRH_c16a]|nr:MAG: polyhydroxyalkanoate synthesis repressor PhaR [Desulfobulbaceae bacterium BRH_c16a]
MNSFVINDRSIGEDQPPFVIAEVGINHEGSLEKAVKMVESAAAVGCECVKFQCHVVEDEMTDEAKKVIPGNADESIWDIMARCALTEDEEMQLMQRCRELNILYMSTPFSRAAANRLESMGVQAYKIGSGECNNTPLISHIARFGKPIILSTGMNDLAAIRKSVQILEKEKVPYALLHCTSMYPTPYEKVRFGAMTELRNEFHCPVGLSDHSLGIWTLLGSVALGASILEKHYTADKSWPGPDIPISIDDLELQQLIVGSRAIWLARGGTKEILPEEQVTIDFAYASVCAIKSIKAGDELGHDNIWVKRPGTGEIKADGFFRLLGKKAKADIAEGSFLKSEDYWHD